jgi:hypothetical protein
MYSGLCAVIDALLEDRKIIPEERRIFNDYLLENRPKRIIDLEDPEECYFWQSYTMPYRLKWLNKHIKLTS